MSQVMLPPATNPLKLKSYRKLADDSSVVWEFAEPQPKDRCTKCSKWLLMGISSCVFQAMTTAS